MHFMSIEVAAQKFLFFPSDPGPSSTELDEETEQDKGAAQTEVPFSHNHLHDLESLWWVAVWVVFYNYFSEGRPPPDHPSFTLGHAKEHLKLAETLFPPALDNATRRDGFQTPKTFQNTCDGLPRNKKPIYDRLNLIRRLLLKHYRIIEAGYPLSVDPSSSIDDIYDEFTRLFSKSKTDCHDLVLDFIPDIYTKLSKEENSKLKLKRRSESTKDLGVARKKPKK